MTVDPATPATSDHEAIRTTLARYCHRCDDGDFERFAELFTDDATFTVLGATQHGREQIRTWIEASLPPEVRGKHLISEPAIELDGDEARAATDFVFVGRAGDGYAITSAGRYLDRMQRVEGAWRIASREIVFLGEGPGATPG